MRRALPGVRAVNAYGQTESFYATTHGPAGAGGHDRRESPSAGLLANMRAYVLGPELTPRRPGVTGELLAVGGPIARGYHRGGGATAQRFVARPFGLAGARMYRTGDLARWDADGHPVYAGRADTQSKVNGIRVEPTEIETVLARHPRSAGPWSPSARTTGTARLVGYVTPATPGTPPRRRPAAVRRRPAARTAWCPPSRGPRPAAAERANGKPTGPRCPSLRVRPRRVPGRRAADAERVLAEV
ncbi:AMP-binding protein [Streptomyces sp. KL116D]|uniref:AMP-binding protein n=1 Tax=Streptomyces sp. KL116D TaxID=3045152 RepID=UPI003558C706